MFRSLPLLRRLTCKMKNDEGIGTILLQIETFHSVCTISMIKDSSQQQHRSGKRPLYQLSKCKMKNHDNWHWFLGCTYSSAPLGSQATALLIRFLEFINKTRESLNVPPSKLVLAVQNSKHFSKVRYSIDHVRLGRLPKCKMKNHALGHMWFRTESTFQKYPFFKCKMKNHDNWHWLLRCTNSSVLLPNLELQLKMEKILYKS